MKKRVKILLNKAICGSTLYTELEGMLSKPYPHFLRLLYTIFKTVKD